MPAEATVLWAQAREKHIPSCTEPRTVPGDPYFLSAAWTPWLVSSWKALEVGRLDKERHFTAVLGRLYSFVHSADINCALGPGMNGEAGPRGFRAAGCILLAVILAEACGSERTVQNGQARAGFPTPPHIS